MLHWIEEKHPFRCDLFGEPFWLDQVFDPANPWHYRTTSRGNKIVYYQSKILNLHHIGRCLVLAVRRGRQ